MKKPILLKTAALLLAACVSQATAAEPVELTGTQGRFDFIKIDPAQRRLLACHTGNSSLDVIDIDASKLIKAIPTGAAQGVALDEKNSRYFVAASKPAQLVIIDSKTLAVTGTVALPDEADLLAYHPGTNRVFVCNDTKPELWIIDPEAQKILQTITFPGGGMEDLVFDPTGQYLFQALKDSDQIARLDTTSLKIVNTFSSAPSLKPHGIALVPDFNAILIAGSGKLSLMDLAQGTILTSADIPNKVDEIAYDPATHLAYCSSGSGTVAVLELKDGKLTAQSSLPGAQGAHSIAADPQSHAAWIAFAKDNKSYAQKITINAPAEK